MLDIEGNKLYFPDEFTDDMFGKNETIYHNKTVYIIDWALKGKEITREDIEKNDAEIYDTSEFLTNHKLTIHLLHGANSLSECVPIEMEVRKNCDVAINVDNYRVSISWFQKRKREEYKFEEDE